MTEKDYAQFYHQYVSDLEMQHAENQRRIRIGLRVNIILPLVFLVISFLIGSSKLIFLILWIVSLFGIAFYLIYVEYTDFKMQERLKEVGEEEMNPLIGEAVGSVSSSVDKKMDAIDEKITRHRQEVAEHVEERKQEVAEHVAERRQEVAEHVAERKQEVRKILNKRELPDQRTISGEAGETEYTSDMFEDAIVDALDEIDREEEEAHNA